MTLHIGFMVLGSALAYDAYHGRAYFGDTREYKDRYKRAKLFRAALLTQSRVVKIATAVRQWDKLGPQHINQPSMRRTSWRRLQ